MSKNQRKPLSKKVRFEVFKRDNFTCNYCGGKAPESVLVVDHIIPVKNGGDNELMNLATSCVTCNQGKGARELSDHSVLAKQRVELDRLAERREQIEFLAKWRGELRELDWHSVEIIESELRPLLIKLHPDRYEDGFTFSGEWRNRFLSWVRTYPLGLLLDCVQKSHEAHIVQFIEPWGPRQHDFLEAIPRIARAQDYEKFWKDVNYVVKAVADQIGQEHKPRIKAMVARAFSEGRIDTATILAEMETHMEDFDHWHEYMIVMHGAY